MIRLVLLFVAVLAAAWPAVLLPPSATTDAAPDPVLATAGATSDPVLATAGAAPGPVLATAGADPCASAPRAFFLDVPDGSTPADAIDCLVWHDLVRGVAHDRFEPGAPVTRAQFASLLDGLITEVAGQLPDPERSRFVDADGVHAAAIERLAAAEIVTGRSAERYEPRAHVRRDQLASLLLGAHEHLSGASEAPVLTHAFVDIDGNVHEPAIATAAELGLVMGTTATRYEPSNAATRAQTAIVLARLLRRTVEDVGIAAEVTPPDGYDARIAPLPASLRVLVERWSWDPGCPVHPADLRLVELVHTDLDGTDRWGMLVVHRDVASAVARVFGDFYDRAFRVERMEPVEHFRGDDVASMDANNTSAFNCRRVTGGTSYSQHSYGRAIDVNPVQNPYVRGSTVLPSAGRAYLDRSQERPGMLLRPGAIDAIDHIGWGWGGDFRTLKDYQHVSATGG